MTQSDRESEDEGSEVFGRFFNFLIFGIALIFVGIVILVVVSLFSGGSGSSGIVIFIGPFPIVFGIGPDAVWLILIGIIITVLTLIFVLITYRKVKWATVAETKFYSASVSSSFP